VAVDSPGAKHDTFTYHIPEGLPVTAGQVVWVPFGANLVQGVVFGVGEESSLAEVREIVDVVSDRPLLSPIHLALARWISDYYLAAPYEAAAVMLPPGIESHLTTTVFPTPTRPFPSLLSSLSEAERLVYDRVCRTHGADLEALKRVIPAGRVRTTVDQLLRKGLVSKTIQLAGPRVTPKLERYVRLLDRTPSLPSRARGQAAVVDFLKERMPPSVPQCSDGTGEAELMCRLVDLMKATGATGTMIKTLVKKGIVAVEEREVRRDPLARRVFPVEEAPGLTSAQAAIWQELESGLRQAATLVPLSSPSFDEQPAVIPTPPVFLLHGVTGSGKTEIYLRAIAEVLSRGCAAIVMVPEIALTPQTISRFSSRFAGHLAVLHSQLSLGEQFDEWRRVAEGYANIVVGARSAVFAPVQRLGLIIIDEEHEWTYKQEQRPPFYHARDVAIKLAGLSGAAVILGSATPDVVTYTHALDHEYHLLQLTERIVPTQTAGEEPDTGAVRTVMSGKMPKVEVVDMRRELRSGNRSIFSRSLRTAMRTALANGQQVILFLNRRGSATFVMCRACGHVINCRRCDLSLTYHRTEESLVCHLCGYSTPLPSTCPVCRSPRIRYFGLGTERLEQEVAREFPTARLLRWDRDVTHGRHAHEKILQQFIDHEADVLVGTQMIAKGLHLPLVTVVGVISADIGLHLPDYRAGERVFQTLTQVAGRAGRGQWSGRVIVQTYNPDHYAIIAMQEQDYLAFYHKELAYRCEHGNPPFSKLVRLVYAHSNPGKCETEAKRLGSQLRDMVTERGLPNLSIVGPAPAFINRVRGRFRWQIVIRARNPHALLSGLRLPAGWSVDVDPVSIL